MRRNILLLTLCVLLVLGSIVGCSSAGDKDNNVENVNSENQNTGSENQNANSVAQDDGQLEPVTITVAMWPEENDEAGLELAEQRLETMKEKYPHITVEPDRWPYDVKSFLPKAESGQLATVYQAHFTEPQKIIGGGYAADITDIMRDYGYDRAISEDLLELVTEDGKIYGIPSGAYTMGVHYNVNLMTDAGLVDESGKPKEAKTWDELLEFAIAIKEETGQPGFSLPSTNNQGGWQFINIAWGFGGEFEEQDSDGNWQAVFNSPEVVEAMEWVKDLKWKHDVIPSNNLLAVDDQDQYFASDQLGMKLRDFGAANGMVVNFGMDKDNLAMSSMPAGNAGAFGQMGGSIYMFNPEATYEEIDAALKWLEIGGFSDKTTPKDLEAIEEGMMVDVEAERIVGPYGVPPIWAQSERFEAEQELRDEYANVDLSLYANYLDPNNGVTINPEPPVNPQELYKLIDNVIQAVWTDENADSKTLLDKAVDDFQRDYLDPYNAQDN